MAQEQVTMEHIDIVVYNMWTKCGVWTVDNGILINDYTYTHFALSIFIVALASFLHITAYKDIFDHYKTLQEVVDLTKKTGCDLYKIMAQWHGESVGLDYGADRCSLLENQLFQVIITRSFLLISAELSSQIEENPEDYEGVLQTLEEGRQRAIQKVLGAYQGQQMQGGKKRTMRHKKVKKQKRKTRRHA